MEGEKYFFYNVKYVISKGKDMHKLGWSEKPKSLKSKNEQADYLPRHSPDVRTVFEI